MARVLVVDDHPDTAASFALLLRHMGHDVCSTVTGAEALRSAQGFRPDAALIDIHMPGMDGHEVARGIRATPGLEHALLVAMTGFGPGDKRRAAEGDFDVFLLKPVDPADLASVLASSVG
jgi:CheY-like chemotaxis protein